MATVHTHTETMSEEAYRELALGNPSRHWELVRGQLWERPGMSVTHDRVTMDVVERLLRQLDRGHFRVSAGLARLRVSAETYYEPDVAVIPTAIWQRLAEDPRALNAYDEPLPLVVEVWSPSTGKRDIELKLPDYQRRGDAEIWFIHPFERTLTAWRRMPDGAYVETTYREGIVKPASLPMVAIDLDELLAS
jgi:Uma2 family endonuclease